MPQTITKNSTGKALSSRENAESAVKAFHQAHAQLTDDQARKIFIKLIVTRGFTKSRNLSKDRLKYPHSATSGHHTSELLTAHLDNSGQKVAQE